MGGEGKSRKAPWKSHLCLVLIQFSCDYPFHLVFVFYLLLLSNFIRVSLTHNKIQQFKYTVGWVFANLDSHITNTAIVVKNISVSSKKVPHAPLQSLASLHIQSEATPVLSTPLVLPFLRFYIKMNHTDIASHVWLISRSVMLLRLIHTVVSAVCSSLLLVSISLYKYDTICLSVRHSGSPWIKSMTSVCKKAHICVDIYFHFSCVYT